MTLLTAYVVAIAPVAMQTAATAGAAVPQVITQIAILPNASKAPPDNLN